MIEETLTKVPKSGIFVLFALSIGDKMKQSNESEINLESLSLLNVSGDDISLSKVILTLGLKYGFSEGYAKNLTWFAESLDKIGIKDHTIEAVRELLQTLKLMANSSSRISSASALLNDFNVMTDIITSADLWEGSGI